MKSFKFSRWSFSSNFLFILIYFFTYSTADACLARINIPDPNKPELYNSIFIAKVESFKLTLGLSFYLDITPPYEVTLSEPIKTIYGEEQLSNVVHISAGCGIPSPQVGKFGIFFVSSEDPKVIEPLFYDIPDSYNMMSTVKKVIKSINTLNLPISSNQQ